MGGGIRGRATLTRRATLRYGPASAARVSGSTPLGSGESGRMSLTCACLVGAVFVLSAFEGCSAKRETVVSSTKTVTMEEGRVTPPSMVDISVVDLHDEPTSDARMEKIVGTIINHGDKPVSRLTVRVDSLDGQGRVVNSVTTPPVAQTVAALGGRASFEASVPRDALVTTYHAVAIAQ